MMNVGMIGLGAMGHSIARHILDHGFSMVLYDMRPESMADLVAHGARAAASVQELGALADPVLVMVNTYEQCRTCVSGLLQTKRGGAVLICSTIAMDQMRVLEQMAGAAGVDILDAPVSGGTAGAEQGTLTIMAAGKAERYRRCLPLFRAFCSTPVYVGEQVGLGQALKAVNQLLVGIHMCAAAEAFNMARQCGLDLDLVYRTITNSAGNSRIFENRGRFFIDRDYSTRSTLAIQLKDTDIACHTAEQAGAPALLGAVCRQLFAAAAGKYEKSEDSIAVIKLLEQWDVQSGKP